MWRVNKDDFVWLTEEYVQYFNKIKDAVTKLYDENNGRELPHFTPHGKEHCEAVENLIYHITSNKEKSVYNKLNGKERFCLSASAWLHDIGMLPSVFELMNPDIPPEPFIIRERHHKTTADFIVEHYRRCNIEQEDKELLAEICFFHRRREPLSKCKQEFIVGFNKKKNFVKLRLLAAYLRLADSLHFDISRAPDPNYNICLTYSIPPDSKVHWIKSQVVNGIDIDCDNHLITVSFKVPHEESHRVVKQHREFEKKLSSIIRIVMDNLREELNSVMNVLLDYNITYFKDAEENRQPVYMSKQMKNDLHELVLNYDIMEHPSASKLLEMTIDTIANIAGYTFQTSEKAKIYKKKHEIRFEEINKTIYHDFLPKLYRDVKKTRPCHKGIDNLIHSLEIIQQNSKSIDDYITKLTEISKQYKNTINDIQNNASEFFKDKYLNHQSKGNKYNVILFGYSQTVINALIGFRRAIIDSELPCLKQVFSGAYGKTIEDKYSDPFHFFICECSPKTQVGKGNRLLYHDGSQYARRLRRHNFKNIRIIPDIVISSIIEKVKDENCILMVGANGFDQDHFMHSAGHGAIIKIVNKMNDDNKILIILNVSNLKKDMEYKNLISAGYKIQELKSNNPEDIDGCWFWRISDDEATRKHIWLPRDENILEELYNESIMFYNPREDVIRIDELNFIISNIGYHAIKNKNEDEQERNIIEFHKVIDERNKDFEQALKEALSNTKDETDEE